MIQLKTKFVNSTNPFHEGLYDLLTFVMKCHKNTVNVLMSANSLTSEVGIGSRSLDLVGDDFRILRMSSSDTGLKEDRALLLLDNISVIRQIPAVVRQKVQLQLILIADILITTITNIIN